MVVVVGTVVVVTGSVTKFSKIFFGTQALTSCKIALFFWRLNWTEEYF